jgi:S-adenosylhomocysteine hydrolase
MSTTSNTTIVVQYDAFQTNTEYLICINTPHFTYTIKTINLSTSSQTKITQKKYITTSVPQKEIIIVNDNDNKNNNNYMSIYWYIRIFFALYVFSFFIY